MGGGHSEVSREGRDIGGVEGELEGAAPEWDSQRCELLQAVGHHVARAAQQNGTGKSCQVAGRYFESHVSQGAGSEDPRQS